MKRISSAFPVFAVLCAAWFSEARMALAVLYTGLPGLDSAGRESLSADLGRSLAGDKSFLVYDARTRHGAALDRALGSGEFALGKDLRERIHAGEIKAGLVLQCGLDSAWGTTLECLFQSVELKGSNPPATLRASFLPGLAQSQGWQDIVTRKFRALLGVQEGEKPVVAGTEMQFPIPLSPARIIREGEIVASGKVSRFPSGSVLETGTLASPVAVKVGKGFLFFFSRSRYGRLPGGTPFLEEGRLGMMDAGIQSNLKKSEANTDSGKTPGKLPDNALLMTPSGLVSGYAKVLMAIHQASRTRVELVQGEITLLPALSSEPPRIIREMEWGETHGYEVERGSLDLDRGESISRQLQAVAPDRIGGLNRLLPRKLFGLGRVAATFPPAVQGHFITLLEETDIAAAALEKSMDAAPAPEKASGNHESGCYLCRPDRLGP